MITCLDESPDSMRRAVHTRRAVVRPGGDRWRGPRPARAIDSDTHNGEHLKVNEGPLLKGSSSASQMFALRSQSVRVADRAERQKTMVSPG